MTNQKANLAVSVVLIALLKVVLAIAVMVPMLVGVEYVRAAFGNGIGLLVFLVALGIGAVAVETLTEAIQRWCDP